MHLTRIAAFYSRLSCCVRAAAANFVRMASAPPVDRKTACPSALRIFLSSRGHHPAEAFQAKGKLVEKPTAVMHVWTDTSLREIISYLQEAVVDARNSTARFSIALVYPDKSGRYVLRNVGRVGSVTVGLDDNKTLSDVKYEAGDYIDITFF